MVLVVLFDLVRLLVWACFDVYHARLQRELDLIIRLTPTHQQQCNDAHRLMLHHQHRVITGNNNGRPVAAVNQHQHLAEVNEDQFKRMTSLLASNRMRVRSLRVLMPLVRVLQFLWGLFLFGSAMFFLVILLEVAFEDST